ncbi:pumilio homolog 12 [Apium graveolens]|uniref:pumilio homolog 12 n=1 Tax=Apium graveolens TaxID=4045 RepID=UPI003D791DD2
MEKRLNELEFDEFEKLLGEIPSATSGNPSHEESGVTNSQKRAFNEKLVKERGSLDEAKVSPNGIQQSNIRMIQQEEPNLPDDQSLTSAFTELSFKDRGIAGYAGPLVNNPSFILNGQSANGYKNFTSNLDPRFIVTPPGPATISSNGFESFDVNVQELKKQQIGYCQPTDNFSGAVPLGHGVQGFHLVPNVPVPGIEFPILPNQQQLYVDAPSGLPYIHPQQLTSPQITWRHVEEEQYYRMHQQFLYLQQLRNQHLEGQHPISENGNFARLMNRNARHLCHEKPLSYHLEPCKQEPFMNKTMIPRSTNQLRSTFPSNGHSGRVSDHVGKHKFPEKILTRANGLNSLRSVKFGSFGGNEPILNVSPNGRALPKEYCNHSTSTPNVELQINNSSSCGLSSGIFDFKLNNSKLLLHKDNSLEEFTGRIYLMAKDQHGCRFLQRKFTEGNQEDVEKIFLEIIMNIVELMTDPFGNYLVQKLLEVCDENQQMQILHSITRKPGDLVRISCDMHGTRAVQKVIETLKTQEQFSIIVSALKPGIVTIIKNMNGNHVAQRCLQYLTSEYSEFLFDAATANCVELATDRHGCCVLQKCLNRSDDEQRHRLVQEITSNALILSQDPFGNYVVQYVFEIHAPWATAEILDQLEGNYVDLSIQKYSSNVVEKCLKYAGEERVFSIIQELINSSRIDQIMQDPYGNYVVQAALNLSKGALHVALLEAIRTNVHVLRSSPYGKKVLSSNGLKK